MPASQEVPISSATSCGMTKEMGVGSWGSVARKSWDLKGISLLPDFVYPDLPRQKQNQDVSAIRGFQLEVGFSRFNCLAT